MNLTEYSAVHYGPHRFHMIKGESWVLTAKGFLLVHDAEHWIKALGDKTNLRLRNEYGVGVVEHRVYRMGRPSVYPPPVVSENDPVPEGDSRILYASASPAGIGYA